MNCKNCNRRSFVLSDKIQILEDVILDDGTSRHATLIKIWYKCRYCDTIQDNPLQVGYRIFELVCIDPDHIPTQLFS